MVAARQKFFGIENVDANTGAVKKDKVIFSWLSNTTFLVSIQGRIVMLDSCRNNPFPNLDDAGRGLAIVDTPLRSIVGYSTAPGAEALDGTSGHSPYTQAFLHLARENFSPTAGCVSMTNSAMRHLLRRIGPQTKIIIE